MSGAVAKYKLLIKASAAQELERIPTRKDRRLMVGRILGMADDPRSPGCRKLSGQDKYRVRQGLCRIVYSIHDDHLLVHVVKAGHRKEVYRK